MHPLLQSPQFSISAGTMCSIGAAALVTACAVRAPGAALRMHRAAHTGFQAMHAARFRTMQAGRAAWHATRGAALTARPVARAVVRSAHRNMRLVRENLGHTEFHPFHPRDVGRTGRLKPTTAPRQPKKVVKMSTGEGFHRFLNTPGFQQHPRRVAVRLEVMMKNLGSAPTALPPGAQRVVDAIARRATLVGSVAGAAVTVMFGTNEMTTTHDIHEGIVNKGYRKAKMCCESEKALCEIDSKRRMAYIDDMMAQAQQLSNPEQRKEVMETLLALKETMKEIDISDVEAWNRFERGLEERPVSPSTMTHNLDTARGLVVHVFTDAAISRVPVLGGPCASAILGVVLERVTQIPLVMTEERACRTLRDRLEGGPITITGEDRDVLSDKSKKSLTFQTAGNVFLEAMLNQVVKSEGLGDFIQRTGSAAAGGATSTAVGAKALERMSRQLEVMTDREMSVIRARNLEGDRRVSAQAREMQATITRMIEAQNKPAG